MTNALDISRCMFIDFETIETDRQRILDYLDTHLSPPATMSKAETIQAWIDDKRPEVLAELVAKTSFDGGFGRLASVAFAIGDGPVFSITTAKPAVGDVPAGYDAELERRVIVRFFAAWQKYCDDNGRAPTLVGHNVTFFDIRWIWKRAIVLNVQPPASWPIASKPWETDKVFDTMLVWEGHGGRISQDRLALALDLPTKDGFDGSMVGEAWRAGEFEKIKNYNAADVETVRSIWKRIVGYQEPVAEVAAEPAAETAPVATEEGAADSKDARDERIAAAVKSSQNGGLRGMYRPGIKAPAPITTTVEGELA